MARVKTSDIRIEDPCSESLDRMERSANARYCERCRRKVHDLSSMTRRQARRFLEAADDVCVSYAYDDDGNVEFRHPVSAALLERRDDVRRLVTVAVAVPLVTVAACNRTPAAQRESVTVSAPSASAAQCEDLIQTKTREVEGLQAALDSAKNEDERARASVELRGSGDHTRASDANSRLAVAPRRAPRRTPSSTPQAIHIGTRSFRPGSGWGRTRRPRCTRLRGFPTRQRVRRAPATVATVAVAAAEPSCPPPWVLPFGSGKRARSSRRRPRRRQRGSFVV
jgi:hypothetical protein